MKITSPFRIGTVAASYSGSEPPQYTIPLRCTRGPTCRQPFSAVASVSGNQTVSTKRSRASGVVKIASWCRPAMLESLFRDWSEGSLARMWEMELQEISGPTNPSTRSRRFPLRMNSKVPRGRAWPMSRNSSESK